MAEIGTIAGHPSDRLRTCLPASINPRKSYRGLKIKLRQLACLDEVIKHGYNESAAAKALHLSQPGVSKQLIALAQELGVELFRHQGKRLSGLTEPGERIAEIAERILHDVQRIHDIGKAYTRSKSQEIVIVTTRYATGSILREAIVSYQKQTDERAVLVYEEGADTACRMLETGEADIGVISEIPAHHSKLACFQIETWQLGIVVPVGHSFLTSPRVSLAQLSSYPVCTYERNSISRQLTDQTFQTNGMQSPVCYSFASGNEILDYVESGIGVGIVADREFNSFSRPRLRMLEATHLFDTLTTSIVMRRGRSMRPSVYDFVQQIAPDLDRDMIEDSSRHSPAGRRRIQSEVVAHQPTR